MRFSLLLLLLSTAMPLFAQVESSSNAYITANPRQNIYDTKWYLNAVQISGFYWNDTSTLVTSMPNDSKFIRFREKFEYGEDRLPKDLTENTFVNFRLEFMDYDDHDDSQFEGTIFTYKSNRKARRAKDPINYYDFILSNHQLILLESEPGNDLLGNLYYLKTLVFSKAKDSLELTTKILGNWKPEKLQNLLLLSSSDTLTLSKVPTVSIFNPELTYYFAINDGYPSCTSNCFSLQDANYVWDSYYETAQYNYSLDIENRQLTIFSQLYSEKPDKIFDIIELTENQMKLTLHQ